MGKNERLVSGKCDMQLVGLKDTFFPVAYELIMAGDETELQRGTVKGIKSIECTECSGMPAGTYILTDMPNLMLSNFTGQWTFTATAIRTLRTEAMLGP